MTLNHLNLTVTNPEETSAFLAKYFGLEARGGNRGMQLLHDDRGMVLTLFKGRTVDYPSTFHIGFIQESAAKVDAINQRLRDDGITVDPPAVHHGAWAFYLRAPGGFVIEVMG